MKNYIDQTVIVTKRIYYSDDADMDCIKDLLDKNAHEFVYDEDKGYLESDYLPFTENEPLSIKLYVDNKLIQTYER